MNHHSLEVRDDVRVFSDEMREVSGLGKGGGQRGREYEKACRRMILAGVRWLEEYPNANPEFHGFKNVYGVCVEDNDDAKYLSEATVATCPDCSGAMHQAAVSHVLLVKKLGWDKYVEEMRKPEEDKEVKVMTGDELKDTVRRLVAYYKGLVVEEIEWVDKNLELAQEWLALLEKPGNEEEFEKLEKKLDSGGFHRGSGWVEMKALIPFSFDILNGKVKYEQEKS